MRVFPQKFSSTPNSDYVKSVQVGQINNKILLFDSHGDLVDISTDIHPWKIKRIINKLHTFLTPL